MGIYHIHNEKKVDVDQTGIEKYCDVVVSPDTLDDDVLCVNTAALPLLRGIEFVGA